MTILFSDLVGYGRLSEGLDPEVLAGLLARYFETMGRIVVKHGGVVEKFIGDAIMAVFGIPAAHEDDALRALRAALDMREALEVLNEELNREHGIQLMAQVGVNTGLVFVTDAARGHSFATGDAVTVAQRLQHAAAPGTILLGEKTHQLTRAAVLAEKLEPLPVKNKAAPLRAYRLVKLFEGATLQSLSPRSQLVGRQREQALLWRAFERVVTEHSCQLLTVLGPPGIGKSRLVREFIDGLSERAAILYGRCLPYGEGITYWPVVEVLRQAAAMRGGQAPAEILRTLAAVVQGEDHAIPVLERVAHLLGVGEVGSSSEETAWALRKLLETLAGRQPIVCIFDDIQFGEQTLLDLIEHVADWSRVAPILLVCLAREDLLEIRPSWGDGKANATSVLLAPLPAEESKTLVGNLLEGATLSERIATEVAAIAGGNPLFVEEIVTMLIEEGLVRRSGGAWIAAEDLSAVPIPATVQALIAARLDRLPSVERDTIERAAMEGEVFHVSGIAELSPDVPLPQLESRLLGLVRKELIGLHPTLTGESAFRFRHLLVRDVAYAALPKQLRAEFHLRIAAWLERQSSVQDEIVGYHLEQTHRYRIELGLPADHSVASRAAERLGAAARRALARGDARAGCSLLERAATLFPPNDAGRLELLPKLGAALFQAGRLAVADGVLVEAIQGAEAAHDTRTASYALVEQQFVRLMVESSRGIEDARRVADAALQVFEKHRDDFGRCRAWCLRAWTEWTRCSSAGADEAWRRAAVYARRTRQEHELFQILCWRASSALFGPTPVPEAIRLCEGIRNRVQSSPGAKAVTSHQLAGLHAMVGEFGTARSLIWEGNEILDDLGRLNSAVSHAEGWVELLAGHPAAAEKRLRQGYGRLEEMGEKAFLASTAAMLAQALYAQGRYAEAEQFCQVSHSTAAAEDLVTQVIWRAVYAKILARRNQMDKADTLAREALELVEQTDWLTHHGDALLDLAEVLRLRGRSLEADEVAREGIKVYERKGNVVSVRRARSWLATAAVV